MAKKGDNKSETPAIKRDLPAVFGGAAARTRIRRKSAQGGSGAVTIVGAKAARGTGMNGADQLHILCVSHVAPEDPIVLAVPARFNDDGTLSQQPVSPKSRLGAILDAAGCETWADFIGATFRTAWMSPFQGQGVCGWAARGNDPLCAKASPEEIAKGRELADVYAAQVAA